MDVYRPPSAADSMTFPAASRTSGRQDCDSCEQERTAQTANDGRLLSHGQTIATRASPVNPADQVP